MRPLSGRELAGALRELAEDLRSQAVKAHLYIVGGAAMALSFDTALSTCDLDALIVRNREPVLEAARRLAARRGWPAGWLNEQAARLMPTVPDPNCITLLDAENLTVTGASPEFLLAMKMRAARQSDLADIAVLLELLRIQDFEHALAVHDAVFPEQPLADVERFGLDRIIADLLAERDAAD